MTGPAPVRAEAQVAADWWVDQALAASSPAARAARDAAAWAASRAFSRPSPVEQEHRLRRALAALVDAHLGRGDSWDSWRPWHGSRARVLAARPLHPVLARAAREAGVSPRRFAVPGRPRMWVDPGAVTVSQGGRAQVLWEQGVARLRSWHAVLGVVGRPSRDGRTLAPVAPGPVPGAGWLWVLTGGTTTRLGSLGRAWVEPGSGGGVLRGWGLYDPQVAGAAAPGLVQRWVPLLEVGCEEFDGDPGTGALVLRGWRVSGVEVGRRRQAAFAQARFCGSGPGRRWWREPDPTECNQENSS